MGKEEEIARIARRLDKMVTKKSAVRGADLQDPGTPVPPSPRRARRAPVRAGETPEGQDETPPAAEPRPCPGQPCPSPRTHGGGRHRAWTLSRSHRSGRRPRPQAEAPQA